MAWQTAVNFKERVSLRSIAERDVTWDPARSQPGRGTYWALCPFHAERTPSFHLRERPGEIGRFHCFGCGAGGSVIDYVMARDGCDVARATRSLQANQISSKPIGSLVRAAIADPEQAARNRIRALELWNAATPDHPLLHTYLMARGIDLDRLGDVPPTLRLHPDLPFFEDGRITHHGPAMLAFIGRQRLVGIHRTWITAAGRARFTTGAKLPKKMLGQTGALFGEPVVLTWPKDPDLLIVGEGIETTLAALTQIKWPGRVQVEAALSLSALAGPGDPAQNCGAFPTHPPLSG